MSRLQVITIALAMAFAGPAPAGVAAALQSTAAAKPAATVLTGTWRSAFEETSLSSDFDVSVWGKNAKAVRTVDLSVRSDGDATLTVTRQVVDARGRTVKGSMSIEEARLRIGAAGTTAAERTEYDVTVMSAERRYPDDQELRWPVDGLRVRLSVPSDDPRTIEIRFDTPDGRGSFWEKLTRRTGAAPPAARTTKPPTSS